MKGVFFYLLGVLLLLFLGCGTESAANGNSFSPNGNGNGNTAGSSTGSDAGIRPGISSGSGAGSGAGSGSSVVTVGQTPGSSCPMANATRACFCNKDGQQVPGRQVCGTVSGWGPCECAEIPETVVVPTARGSAEDPVQNKGSATFDWLRTVPEGGSCEAGYYEGAFDGLYNSQATALASLGFWTTVPVEGSVQATILEKPGTAGEFLEIADGKFLGLAMDSFPFEGDFFGTLNCPTKSFDGVLKNCFYMLGADKYGFEGIALSRYDVFNHTFVNGVWSVTEPQDDSIIYSPFNPDAGGRNLVYPDPLPVQPGSPLPSFYPVAFKGGTGNWTMSFVHP